jgi:hypothetical protein
LIFPGVVMRSGLGRDGVKMGFCWRGLACEPLSLFRAGIAPPNAPSIRNRSHLFLIL